MFLPKEERPSLPRVILPSVFLHGLFDYSLTALQWVKPNFQEGMISNDEARIDVILLIILWVLVSCGSCCFLATLSGLRCCSGRGGNSCCCSPGFWETRHAGEPTRTREVLQ